jgi:hypothetical protein
MVAGVTALANAMRNRLILRRLDRRVYTAFDRAERGGALRFRARGNGDNVEAYGGVLLATTAPLRVKWLGFRRIPPGGVIEDVPLDAAGRKRVIEAVLSKLEQNYVYLETAEKMACTLSRSDSKK